MMIQYDDLFVGIIFASQFSFSLNKLLKTTKSQITIMIIWLFVIFIIVMFSFIWRTQFVGQGIFAILQ